MRRVRVTGVRDSSAACGTPRASASASIVSIATGTRPWMICETVLWDFPMRLASPACDIPLTASSDRTFAPSVRRSVDVTRSK